ncbi:MAG: LacI family DNA-binding transcriptional regulator [Lachnospiraceae bacterium]|nr:LacI family DNA-binding transcriptional regulator [Lachnospiraceae bacterium]
MRIRKVTMKDIADACGLSRNTVSKVFNGRGAVPEKTRAFVLSKAQELGYYQMPAEQSLREVPKGSIAVLTRPKLLTHGFGSFFITSFTDQISRKGYRMQMYEISPKEISSRVLPPHLNLSETAGILCIELFDRSYMEMICALGKPTVFVDACASANKLLMQCDFVSMENIASEIELTSRMIAAGAKTIGYVGDRMHCNSFYERWVGCQIALQHSGLQADERFCILDEDNERYGDTDWLLGKLNAMPGIPDGFVCANDYLALHLMTALKRKGLSIPDDVMVAGFDGSLEASLYEPSLATAYIPSEDIGRLAAAVLHDRIRFPEQPYHWTYVKTTPVSGGSIRKPANGETSPGLFDR